MRWIHLVLTSVLATVLSLPALAETPTPLLPGDDRIQAARIPDHTTNYSILARLPDGSERELQQVRRAVRREGDRMVVTWETDVQGIHVVDRVETLADSLRLLTAATPTQHDGGIAVQHLDYRERATAYLASPEGERMETLEPKLEGPLFPGAMASVILLALPLEEGASFRWPVPQRDLQGVGEIEARVEGREAVALGDRKVEAWRVLVTAEIGAATVWVTDTAPYIVRKEYSTAQATVIWQPAD